MTALVQPSDVEAEINDLLRQEISKAARRNTFEALLQEIIHRYDAEIDEIKDRRLALEQTHKGKSE